MSFILSIIRISVTIILVSGLTALYMKNRRGTDATEDEKNGMITLRMPKLFYWIGLVTGTIFAAIIVLCIFFSDSAIYEIVFFCIFILMSGSLLAVSTFWEIRFGKKDDYFCYTNLFGKKRKIYYTDITYWDTIYDKLVFKVNKKRYSVYPYVPNYNKFLKMIKKKSDNKMTGVNNEKVGAVKRALRQVRDPIGFVIVMCMFFINGLCSTVILIIFLCSPEVHMGDRVAMSTMCIIAMICCLGFPFLFVFGVNNRKKYPRLARLLVKRGYFIDE